MNLRGPDDVGQERVGNLDLHGRLEQAFPIRSRLAPPIARLPREGVILRIDFPRREINDALGVGSARQRARQNHPLRLSFHRQGRRLAGVDQGQNAVALDRQQSLSDFLKLERLLLSLAKVSARALQQTRRSRRSSCDIRPRTTRDRGATTARRRPARLSARPRSSADRQYGLLAAVVTGIGIQPPWRCRVILRSLPLPKLRQPLPRGLNDNS